MKSFSSKQKAHDLQARAVEVANRLNETAYVGVSPDLSIVGVSSNLQSMLPNLDAGLEGRALTSVFAEFVGAEESLQAVLHGAVPTYRVERVQRQGPDGSTHYFTFHVFPLGDSGPAEGLFLIVEDISRYAVLEQNLVQNRNELRLAQEALIEANTDLDRHVHERTRELLSVREQLMQQNERLRALRAIDLTALGSSDMQLALGAVTQEALIQLKVDTVIVMLYHPKFHYLETASTRGLHSGMKFKLHIGEGVMGKVALNRRPYLLADEQAELKSIASINEILDKVRSFFAIPLTSHGELLGVIGLGNASPRLPDQEWVEFFENLAGQAAMVIDNIRSFENLQRSHTELMLAYETTIEGWSRAISLRDQETQNHTERMVDLTIKLAEKAGLAGEELIQIRRGVLLHDIGKIAIPDAILLKPDSLSIEELEVMRKHPSYAYQMLQPIPYLHRALEIPYCHHERWDGNGYPRGLKEDQIPIAARIFAVVDVWDALRSNRPYRSRWPDDQTIDYIRSQSGKQFDPKMVDMFLELQAHMSV